MSLDSFFVEQFDQLKDFMLSPAETVRCVRIDEEMKPMFHKALARMEEESDFPHVLLNWQERFSEPLPYFNGLLEFITGEFQRHREELAGHGVRFDRPGGRKKKPRSPRRFMNYVQALAQNLPDSVGSLVFVLDPEEIQNPRAWRKSVQFLISNTRSRWLKFVILDSRVEPLIGKLDDEKAKMKTQTFYLGPAEMERRATEDIEEPGAMDKPQGRQTLGLLAGFAFGNKDYARAEELQRRWLAEASDKGDPREVATAWYNLGNTLLESGSFEEATKAFCEACSLCVEHELDSLSPFVYTNLGVSLHRQGAFKPAFDSLRVARDMFKAQNQLPGRIHVIDTLAGMYALDGNEEKAEKTWLYALKLNEGISASHFSELRENGGHQIREKLERFYRETGQAAKIDALKHNGKAADEPAH